MNGLAALIGVTLSALVGIHSAVNGVWPVTAAAVLVGAALVAWLWLQEGDE